MRAMWALYGGNGNMSFLGFRFWQNLLFCGFCVFLPVWIVCWKISLTMRKFLFWHRFPPRISPKTKDFDDAGSEGGVEDLEAKGGVPMRGPLDFAMWSSGGD